MGIDIRLGDERRKHAVSDAAEHERLHRLERMSSIVARRRAVAAAM